MILAAAAGCDNVAWGGFDVRLKAPPERESAAVDEAVPDAPALPELPSGPVLFRVDRSGSQSTISPVGEIASTGLVDLTPESDAPGFRDHFAGERMVGREFLLFADGARVGRFIARDSVRVDGEACSQPPSVNGIVELTPQAASATRFLALEATAAGNPEWDGYAPVSVDQSTRTTAANVAGTVIMAAGARWPPSMAGARGDVQLARFNPDEPPILAGTYLYQDQMAIVEAVPSSYSFFYLAEDGGIGYRYSYYWFRVTGDDGKGAARLYGHMDWDRDGRQDVLLEVLGADSRWHAALARTDGGFERTFEDACGSSSRQAPQGE